MSKNTAHIFSLDSGAFTLWKRSIGDPNRIANRQQVQDLLKVHKSRKKVAEVLGWPYGYVSSLAADAVEDKISLETYAKFVDDHKKLFIGGVFTLDEIGNDDKRESGENSYENWLELRRLGVDTIPIFHIGEDEGILKKYMDLTDYIGLGAIAKMSTNDRLYGLDHIWKKYLKNPDGTAKVRVHGMGTTSAGIVLRFPWYSVDSSMAASTAIFGGVLMPTLTEHGPVYDKCATLTVSNQSLHKTGEYNNVVRQRGKGAWHMRTTPGKASDSLYQLPPRAKRLVIEYLEGFGYRVDDELGNRTLNPLMFNRKRQRPKEVAMLFDDDIPEVEEEPVEDNEDVRNNVTRNWVPRLNHNLFVIDELLRYHRERGCHVRWFNVAVSSIFDVIAMRETKTIKRTLVSYAYLMSSRQDRDTRFLQKIRDAANGRHQ